MNTDLDIQNAQRIYETVIDFLVNYSFQVVGAIVILIAGMIVSRWVARLVAAMGERRNIGRHAGSRRTSSVDIGSRRESVLFLCFRLGFRSVGFLGERWHRGGNMAGATGVRDLPLFRIVLDEFRESPLLPRARRTALGDRRLD